MKNLVLCFVILILSIVGRAQTEGDMILIIGQPRSMILCASPIIAQRFSNALSAASHSGIHITKTIVLDVLTRKDYPDNCVIVISDNLKPIRMVDGQILLRGSGVLMNQAHLATNPNQTAKFTKVEGWVNPNYFFVYANMETNSDCDQLEVCRKFRNNEVWKMVKDVQQGK